MYESFYGLKEKPFTLLPDPDYLYLSPKHQRALTLLEYGMMNHAGFSVICGDTGAGKTTLIRRLLSELGDDTKVGLITNTHHSFGELLNWVLMAFGLDGDGKSKAQMHQMFIEFLIEQYAQNKHSVLIVDEAQNMSADTLEELRMLSNINADKDQVLQVILAGQPALRETLRKPELMQFAQRIAVDYYLESLSQEETQAYIQHRLSIAGAHKTIFTNEACSAIFKYSGGTPRLINLLCDTALVYGFAEQSESISEKLVHDVVREQHNNSIIPTFNTSQNDAWSNQGTEQVEIEAASHVNREHVQKKPDANEHSTEVRVEHHKADEVRAGLSHSSIQQAANVASSVADSVAANMASSTVKHASQAVPVNQSEVTSGVEQVQSHAQTFAATSAENNNEQTREAKDESNVTPIKLNKAEVINDSQDVRSEQNSRQAENLESGKSTSQAKVEKKSVRNADVNSDVNTGNYNRDGFTDTIKTNIDELSAKPGEEDLGASQTARFAERRHRDEDVYPIVHIEENPKKGLNVVLLALVGGMFVASLIMMTAAWIMFGSSANTNQQSGLQIVNEQAKQTVENRELKALEKERDAALAVTRALERERDAALQAAKAQEEIRAAELRVAEIIATQERAASKRLQQARARAREAEKAESKALARELKLKRKSEKREAELEQQRLVLLREERRRLDALVAEEQIIKQQQRNRAEQEQSEQIEVEVKAVKVKKAEPKIEKQESFSANPCNSPSAKFLSTCKK